MSSIGQGVGGNNNFLMQLQRLQQMMQQGGNYGSMNNPQLSPTTPFTQPMGTTLNSMGSPAPQPAATPGQINPPQGANAGGITNPLTGNAMNMKGITGGIGQLAGALSPKPAQMPAMQVPNLQLHQPGAGANPQMLQQMLVSGRFGAPGQWQDTQGYGYA